MSADDFQQLLNQLKYGLAAVEQQKTDLNALQQHIKTLESNASRDPESQKKLVALNHYQQSERYAVLRDKAENELLQLQQQCGLLQEKTQAGDARPVKPASHASKGDVTTSVVANKKRFYI